MVNNRCRRTLVWPTCDLGGPRRCDVALFDTARSPKFRDWTRERILEYDTHIHTHARRVSRTLPGHLEDTRGKRKGEKENKSKMCELYWARAQPVGAMLYFDLKSLPKWRPSFKLRETPRACALVGFLLFISCLPNKIVHTLRLW